MISSMKNRIRNKQLSSSNPHIGKMIVAVFGVHASYYLVKNANGSSKLDVPTIIDRFLENNNDRTCNVRVEEIFDNDKFSDLDQRALDYLCDLNSLYEIMSPTNPEEKRTACSDYE